MRYLIAILLLLITVRAFAPNVNVITILGVKSIYPYERIWNAICFVESSGRENVINEKELAYGIVQCRGARLSDFNRQTGNNYTLNDCLQKSISKIVFSHNASKFAPDDYAGIAKDWNKSTSEAYFLRVLKALDNESK